METEWETQDPLANAVSEDINKETQSSALCLNVQPTTTLDNTATTFSRIRKRGVFGSAAKTDEDKSVEVDTHLPIPAFQNHFVAQNDDSDGDDDEGGLFHTNDSMDGSVAEKSDYSKGVDSTGLTMPSEEDEVPTTIKTTPDKVLLPDNEETEHDDSAADDDDSEPQDDAVVSDQSAGDTYVNKGGEKPPAAKPDLHEELEKDSDMRYETDKNDQHNMVLEDTPLVVLEEASVSGSGDTPKVDYSDKVDEELDVSPAKKKLPDRQSLIDSTDQLFLQVTDREKVTVKDILQSLQTEYHCPNFDKESKAIVRDRLTGLILGKAQPLEESKTDQESSEEEQGQDSESEASGAEAEAEDSDFEAPKRRKKTTRKRTNNKKASTERRNRVKRKSASAVKAAAVRIQAEQLRKKRLEELRVRNEELQLLQNQEEQNRAAKIAAKLETDTDEIRLAWLEKRLDLLQKLDKKRITVIQDSHPVKVREENGHPDSAEQQKNVAAVESEPESNEAESSDDDMELELVGKPTKLLMSLEPDSLSLLTWADKGIRIPRNKDAAKAVKKRGTTDTKNDDFLMLFNETRQSKSSPGQSMNARSFLKKRLLSRQRQIGNRWLARELGYQTEKEHVDECLKIENQKRLLTIKQEQERIEANERKLLRERLLNAENDQVKFHDDEDEDDEAYNDPGDGGQDDDEPPVESDDEVAMAIELNQMDSGVADEDGKEADLDNDKAIVTDSNDATEGDANTSTDSLVPVEKPPVREVSLDSSGSSEKISDTTTVSEQQSTTFAVNNTQHENDSQPLETQPRFETQQSTITESSNREGSKVNEAEEASSTLPDEEAPDDVSEKAQGPRNSAWREMLKKEAAKLKKLKNRKGEMIDDEADEEEEEEIVGLEDFGFAMHKKNKKDDDDEKEGDDELDEDDMKDVVDDVSDGEGDEEEGEKARKAMEVREEKERHKEIMRRMREGYDGRRGGIAGGGAGARGVHRFDQLVAADNREDAKRLGLLNDDEMESEDEKEEKADDDEEEDEALLLDKMLKDRFLHRSSVDLDENFPEDEEEDKEKNGPGNQTNDEDLEEKEQERMAKRFTKRARMQRLIEAHGHEEEFSQMKLIEEDTTLKEELQNMKASQKVVYSRIVICVQVSPDCVSFVCRMD